jgi:Asp-tRNA(Asn)/Glu-tRNA(Gln) amidotransferase A subunit family amidase
VISALAVARAVELGERTVRSVVEECLAAIDAGVDLGAWVAVDPEAVRQAADALDQAGAPGPFHGLPWGVKDIIETADLPTECGSALYAGRQTGRDAAVVATLRDAGGLVLGKTVTTELAGWAPVATRNPHDPARTPGGSSSGSAAAVAAGMVPAAIGTQTAGSIVRPAAFCGIAGFKPTKGSIPTAGVSMWAWNLDTIGVLAATVVDAAFAAGVLAGRDWRVDDDAAGAAPRLGLLSAPWDDDVATTTLAAVHEAAAHLPAAVVEVAAPTAVAGARRAQEVVMAYEGARALVHERRVDGGRLTPTIRRTLDAGAAITVDEYGQAMAATAEAVAALPELFVDVDVLVTPSAPGTAPPHEKGTGDPVCCRAWTLLGCPAVNVPGLVGEDGLPLGLQVVGRPGDDRRTLAAAAWIESRLGGAP